MDLRQIFILSFFFIAIASAGPISPNESRCSRHCKSKIDPRKFLYKEKTTYVYDYESTNKILLREPIPVKPFTIKARLEITNLDNCEMVLEIKNARLFISGKNEGALSELMLHPLLFTFEDGKIEEICPDSNDLLQVINVKRAMLSALQNTMKSFEMDYDYRKENDIVGTCMTTYGILEKSKNKTVVKKSKDLADCWHRRTGNTALLTTFLPTSAGFPVMYDEFYDCKQVIENGIITNSTCLEHSKFNPIEENRIYNSKAEISLYLIDILPMTEFPSYEFREREHLLYSHQPEKYSESASGEAIRVLQDMCTKIIHRQTIDPELPSLFSRLVRTFRNVQPQELEDIYEKLENGYICSSTWLKNLANDALPHIGHEGSVRIMVKKIQKGIVGKLHSALWITSLAFIEHPTEKIISAAVPLLDYEKVGKQALLGITAMSNNYCKKNTNCEHSRAIQQVIRSLSRYLNYGCKVSGNREINQIITALKGFGNLGRVGDTSRQILQCAAQTSNEITIRLAAIEAFRRVPCAEDVKDQLYDIFSRFEEPVEVRIAAYLGVMKCADTEVIRKVKHVYDSERLIQIKAFIYSHVTNLKKSSSPLKEDIRRILLKFQFQPQPLDIRKYSQYSEWSTYLESMKIGGEFESSIVYSQNSFIPRSFMTNFTSFLQGNILNFMEVGGRIEGLDYLMESLFSPAGKYGHMSFSEFASHMLGISDRKLQPNWPRSRINHKYQSKIDLFSKKMKASIPSEARGSFYFKHQGSELLWISIDEKTNFNLGNAVDFMDILSELAKKKKIDTAHSLYLDTSIIYPSISGSALTLDIAGAVILGLKSNGKIDIRRALSSSHNIDIDGKANIGVASEITVEIKFKSLPKTSNIKYVSKVHGNAVVKGKLMSKDGRLLNLRIDLPDERLDVLSVSADVIHTDEYGREISNRPSRNFSGCTKVLRNIMGCDICIEGSVPRPVLSSESPFVPFNGPLAMKISLLKTDHTMRGYLLNIELPDKNVYGTKKFKFEFDTPGSSLDRKYSLEIVKVNPSNDDHAHSLQIQLQTPFKIVEARAAIVNSEEKKSVKLDFILDQKHHWAFLANIGISKIENYVDYEILLKFSHPNREPVIVLGSIFYISGLLSSEASIQFYPKEEGIFKELTGMFYKDGVIEFNRKAAWRLTTNLGVSLKFMNLQIKSMLQHTGERISSDLKIDYIMEGGKKHKQSFGINFNVQDLSSSDLVKTMMRVKINSTQYPQYNIQLDWNFQHKTKEYLENGITLKGGSNLRKLFNVFQRSEVKRNDLQNVISENMLEITAPEHGIDYELKVALNHNGESSNTISAEIKKDLQVCVSSNLYYYLLSKNPLQMGIEFDLKYPGRIIKYSDEINQISPEEFRGKTAFQWQEGHLVKFDYTYKIKSHSDNVYREVDAAFDAPWLHVPMKHKGLLRMSGNSIDIKSSTSYEGKPPYKVDIKISPKGQSKVNVDLPAYGKSDIFFDVSEAGTLLKFDIIRPETNRRILGQVALAKRPKSIAKLEVSWDADRDPSYKLSLETEAQKVLSPSEKYFAVIGKFQYKENIYFDTRGKFDSKILQGPHDLQLDVKQAKPISIKMHYEAKASILKSQFSWKHENKQLQTMVTGKYLSQRSRLEIVCDAGISSSNRKWDGKKIHFSHTQDFSDSLIMKSLIEINQTPEQQYKFKTEYISTHRRSADELKATLLMQTPIRGWKTREININLEQKRNNYTFNADLTTDLGKKLIVYSKVEKNEYGGNFQYLIQTPASKILKNAKIQLIYHLQPSNYKIKGEIFVDDRKKLEMDGNFVGSDIRNFDSNLEFKSDLAPAFSSRINSKMNSAHKKFDVVFSKDLVKKFSGKLSAESDSSLYNGGLLIGIEGNQIIDMSINCQHKSTENQECRLNLSGAIKPIIITLIYRKEKSLIIPTFKICQQTNHRDSECIEIEGHYRNENKNYYGTILREAKMNIRRPRAGDISLEFVNSKDKYNYKNKLIFMSSNMKLGYDAYLNLQSPSKSGQVQLYFPSRVIEGRGNFQTKNGVTLISEFLLDAEKQPLKKLSVEFIHKDNQEKRNRQIFSKLDIKHPEFRKPISAKLELKSRETGNVHPIDAKVELDYSNDTKHKIICSIHTVTTSGQGNNTLVFNLQKAERQYLDFTVKTHLGYLKKQMSYGLQWEFLSQRSKKKSGFTLLRINPQENTFGIRHQCDLMNFEGTGKWTSASDNVFKTEFIFLFNSREPKKITAISYVQSCIDLAYHAKADEMPNSKYHFCINSANRNLLSISANALYDTAKVTDFSLMFDRKSNHPFTLDLKWMPQIYRKLLKYFSDLYVQMQKKFAVPNNILKLYQDMITTLTRDFIEPLCGFLSEEFSLLSYELRDDMRTIKEILRQQYEIISTKYKIENSLQYLRKYIKDTLYEFNRFKRTIIESVKKNIRDITSTVISQIDSICKYGTYCYELKSEFQKHGLKGVLKELCKDVGNMLRFSTRIKIKFGDLNNDIRSLCRDILNSLKKFYGKIQWKFGVNWTSISDFVMNHARSVGKAMTAIEDFALHYFSQITEKLKNIKNNVLKNRDVKNVINTLEEIRKQMAEELKKIKVDQMSRRLKDSFIHAFSSFSLKDTIFVIVFNPDQGKLRTEIFLPGLKHTLKALKRPTDIPVWIAHLAILIYQSKFPPMSAEAIIINGQHFKTFDGSVFNISDNCSYLLMHDFGDENFTIISKHIDAYNYEPSQKSIVILNPEFNIEINPFTSMILLNDVPIELPFYAYTISLTRLGDIINARDKRGVEVKCHLVYKFCIVSLSGWYFRKTGGLFGTFDYEPSNDFLDSNGNLAESVKQFSQGWKISPHCKPDVHFTQQIYQSDDSTCQKFFSHPESPLQPCFNQVPPDDYLKMCIHASVAKFNPLLPSKPACDVAASYATVCQKYSYKISLPSECLNCIMNDGANIEYGEETRLYVDENNRHSLDVVFIFEENDCNIYLIKKIDEFTDILESLFNSAGFVNNRYSLVAYGGKNEEYKAHTHTVHGQIFFDAKDMQIAMKNVKLNYESHPFLDVFAVILYANDLPFREKVDKMLILIPCGRCVSSAMSVSHHDMMKKILDSGVYFHVLTDAEILRQYSSSDKIDSKTMSSDDTKVLELPGWRIPFFSGVGVNMNDTKAMSSGDDIKILELPGWRIPFFSDVHMNTLVYPGWRIPLGFDGKMNACTSLAIDLIKSYSNAEKYKKNSFSEAQTWPAFSKHISSISPSYCKMCKCVQDEHYVPRIQCKPCQK